MLKFHFVVMATVHFKSILKNHYILGYVIKLINVIFWYGIIKKYFFSFQSNTYNINITCFLRIVLLIVKLGFKKVMGAEVGSRKVRTTTGTRNRRKHM